MAKIKPHPKILNSLTPMMKHRWKHSGKKSGKYSFQKSLLLSAIMAVATFLASLYWDEIIQAVVAVTARPLSPPAPLPIENILRESDLPAKCRKFKHAEITDPNSASLRKKFSLDFNTVLCTRLRNMKKYNYNYSVYGIDRRANLSLQEFRDVYDGKWPVIITDVIPKWPAANWTGHYLASKFGKDHVTLKGVDEINPELDDIISTSLGNFYKYMNTLTQNQWTYVNDELFILMRPELYNALGDILYQEEDFYKLFPAEIRPWNALMLWGTANSHSAFHMDPYNWSGTNAVLWGTKRWKMYPPGQDHLLYAMSNPHGSFPLDCYSFYSDLNAFNIDHVKYPLFTHGKSIDFDQHAGELVLLPTGWYHQVYNLEETFAVSSQWMNRNNYRVVLEEILRARKWLRDSLPRDVDSYTPSEKVKAVLRLMPEVVLEVGLEVTQFVMNQTKMTQAYMERNGYHLPFQSM